MGGTEGLEVRKRSGGVVDSVLMYEVLNKNKI